MKTKNKLMSLAGFTLVELLIVMLIVAILSIAMLPMYKKYMCKAKYTAEGLPILATIKTQVDLFCYEHSFAPGVSDRVYCWTKDANSGAFSPAYYDIGAVIPGVSGGPTIQPLDSTSAADSKEKWHLRSLIKEAELSGKLIQPNHVYYACINSGDPKYPNPTLQDPMPGDYGYAIGVFGDGTGLPMNSGVATMEVHMSAPQVGVQEDQTTEARGITILGTWSNFEGSGIDPSNADGQIKFSDASSPSMSACVIWSGTEMEGLNQSATTMANIQDAVDALTVGANGQAAPPCGEWEFPQYKN